VLELEEHLAEIAAEQNQCQVSGMLDSFGAASAAGEDVFAIELTDSLRSAVKLESNHRKEHRQLISLLQKDAVTTKTNSDGLFQLSLPRGRFLIFTLGGDWSVRGDETPCALFKTVDTSSGNTTVRISAINNLERLQKDFESEDVRERAFGRR